MTSVPLRSPRRAANSIDSGPSPVDAASTTSHSSQSRYSGGTGTRSAPSSASPTSLSLAEACARANGDYAAALDQVLAERNMYCLDAAKLSSENVRIWNLMGRIRKENEALKAKIMEYERGASVNRASPLGPAAVIASGSPSAVRRRPPGTGDSDPGSSPIAVSSPRSNRYLSRADSESHVNSPNTLVSSASLQSAISDTVTEYRYQRAHDSQSNGSKQTLLDSASASEHKLQLEIHKLAQGVLRDERGETLDSPLSSNDHVVSRGKPNPLSDANNAAHRSVESAQHHSIMQQRAAAQAQTLALAQSKGLHNPNLDLSGSGDSAEFEAFDRSSGSVTDEVPPTNNNLSSERAKVAASLASTMDFPHDQGIGYASMHNSLHSLDKDLYKGSSAQTRARPDATPLSAPPIQRSFSSQLGADERNPTSPRPHRTRTESRKLVLSPRLDSSLLRVANLKFLGTNYKLAERGKEAISFYITVEILQPPASWGLSSMSTGEPAPPTFWTLEKNYSDIVGLDARIKQKSGKKAAQRLAPLPERPLFKDHAPAKVDQRKALLEIYLQSLLVLDLPDKDDVCTFLCTDVVSNRVRDFGSLSKDGFLTKKGQNLGRWVTRFYVLRNATLNYYEMRGGAQIGSINIREAQIGRQQKSSTTNENDENSYRHAFLILEKRPGSHDEHPHVVRHVLCAESDDERDEWVDVLVRAIAEMEKPEEAPISPKQITVQRGISQSSMPSSREVTDLSDRHRDDQTFSDIASSSSVALSQYDAMNRKPERDTTPHSPRSHAMSLDQSRSSSARQEPGGESAQNGRYQSLSISAAMSPSASYRSITEPRSPAPRHATLGDSQENPGSPGPKHESLPKAPKPAISAPMNGAPIPNGYKFGAKDDVPITGGESKKDDKKRFWQGFRGFTGHDKLSREPRPVFGIPLAESIAISSIHEGLELPSVVYRCIEYLEKRNAATEEGIYRLSGSSAVIKSLKDRFNAEGDVDLLSNNQYYDPHAIAGLLKTFLRELPTSVLTRELHMDFIRVNDIADRTERVNELGHLVSQLPLANYSLLRTLCSHLIKIIEHADINKMTMRNVGIVFSPTLAIGAGIFALFLTEFDTVFCTDANGDPAPKRIEEDILPPDPSELGITEDSTYEHRTSRSRNKRNSIQYKESQAERLLGLEGRRLSYRETEEDLTGISEATANHQHEMVESNSMNAGSADVQLGRTIVA